MTDVPITGCRSDDELGAFGDIVAVLGPETWDLKAAAPAAELKARRAELITAVRGGKHTELIVHAQTYRQKRGQPNRRFLRFADDALGAVAASFIGQPFLVDHNTHEQGARKGTILASELIPSTRGTSAFDMTFSVVKPDAVISILDGTLDRFSIGWFPLGPVTCSVHKLDVRAPESCGCWPGDTVIVDGQAKNVEYEFSSAEGKELSGVNVPAVKGTRIDDVHAALAAELFLPSIRRKERVMPTPLAAVLGVPSLQNLSPSDEERLAAIVAGYQREAQAATQEAARFRAELGAAQNTITAITASANKARVDTLLAGAYSGGKLKWGRDELGKAIPSGREARLRLIATRDGVDALAAEIAELEVVVPVGDRQLTAAIVEPERTLTGVIAPEDNPYLAVAAHELGIPIEELKANARAFGSGVR